MSDPKNPPAFPSQDSITLGDFAYQGHPGMALRDWFAGQALAGLCAMYSKSLDPTLDDFEAVAKDAFDYADALLIERERGE